MLLSFTAPLVVLTALRLSGSRARQAGQATVEYVVVVLAASLLAGLFIRWIDGTGKIGDLLNRLFDVIIGKIG